MEAVSSQLEALSVGHPPLPCSLPQKLRMESNNAGLVSVTVNDSHTDSSMGAANAAGLPKSGRPWASVRQSRHEPLLALRSSTAGLDIVPNVLSAVIDPF